jgi:hypothetical protein
MSSELGLKGHGRDVTTTSVVDPLNLCDLEILVYPLSLDLLESSG